MNKLKSINKTVKTQQLMRLLGGSGLIGIGLYLLCDYFEHSGWTSCQKFIRQYYPEEYALITEKVIEQVNKH